MAIMEDKLKHLKRIKFEGKGFVRIVKELERLPHFSTFLLLFTAAVTFNQRKVVDNCNFREHCSLIALLSI